MQQYNVYIQGTFFATISTAYTSDALKQVTLAIENGEVPTFDSTKPHMIRLEPT